ncbi:MAG: YlbF family regulator [Clostridiaceae bacterium]|nr:YlbF family regulator [Clostridiaceae bacterium]
MSVYNYAHELASALKGSSEYQAYKRLEAKVKENPEAKVMLEDFRKRHFEVQGLQMTGQQVENSKISDLQNQHKLLMQNPLIAEFMSAEYKLTQMMADIYKILGEALDLDLGGIE